MFTICSCISMIRSASKLILAAPLRAALTRPFAIRPFASSAAPEESASDRDVTVSRGTKQTIALLRRVALALESGKSWRTSVDKQVLVVPKDAEFSVEHESEGNEHCLELQFRWVADPNARKAKKSNE